MNLPGSAPSISPNCGILSVASQSNVFGHYFCYKSDKILLQGHHRNGNQAARRPHMMCSICGRRLTTPLFGVRGDRDELSR